MAPEKTSPLIRIMGLLGLKSSIVILSLVTGSLVILVYSILDYLLFTEATGTLWDILFFEVSAHEIFVRLVIMAAFLAFGLFAAGILARIRETEQALNISESRFETIANYTPSWENWVDSDGRLLWVNPAVESLTGYSVAEALRMEEYPLPLVLEEDREVVGRAFHEAVDGSSGRELQFRVRRKDGRVIWAEASWQPLYDDRGRRLGHRASIRDITRRKAATQALRYAVEGAAAVAGEDFFDTLANHLVTALDVRHVLVSEAMTEAREIRTVAAGRPAGSGIAEELSPSRGTYQELLSCLAGQKVSDVTRYLPEDHVYHQKGFKTILGAPLSDSFGEPVGLLLVFDDKAMDATSEATVRSLLEIFAVRAGMELERKRAEKQLRRSEEKYRILFERSADALLIIDNNTFIDCNEATVKMLGYDSREEFLRTHPSALSPAFQSDGRPSYEKAEEMMKIAFEHGSHRFEWDHQRANGEVFPVEVLLTAVPKDGRQILHVVWRDITERRRAEEELRRSEEKYRVLFERSTDAVFILDNGEFVDCNAATLDLLGVTSKEELLGTNPTVWSPEFQSDGALSREKAAEYVNVALKEGSHRFEWEHRRADGQVFPADVRLTAVPTGGDAGVIHAVVRDISKRKRAENTLRFMVEGTSATIGEDFFPTMVQKLAAALGCKSAQVAQLMPGGKRLRTLSLWVDGAVVSDLEYDFADTPCAGSEDKQICVFTSGVQEEFPHISWLKEMGAESFLGVPLFGSDGQLLGILAVVDDKPMSDTVAEIGRSLAGILAARASAEIERSRALAGLKESEEKFRLISEQSIMGIFILQQDRLRFVNQAVADMFGYPTGEMLDWGSGEIYKIVHPDDRAFVSEQARRKQEGAAGEDVVVNYIWKAVTKSGSSKWIELFSKTIIFEGKSADLVVCVDVTDKKRAEEAIRKSQQMVQTVLNTIPVRVFWKNRDLEYTGCNRLFAQDAGLNSPDEIVGKTDYDLAWKQMADRYRADDRKVIDAGMLKLGYEEPQTTEDGRTLWLRTSKVPFRDQDDNIIGVLGSYEDVTQRKKAALALEASEATLKGILETAPVGIGLFSDNDGLKWVNDRLLTITGYSLEKLRELYPEGLFISPEEFERVDGVWKQDITEMGVCLLESVWKRKDGRSVDVALSVARIDRDREDSDLVFTAMDITARKATENALRKTTIELQSERAALDDKNAALREVLEHLEREKAGFKHRVWDDVEKELLPFLDSMRQYVPDDRRGQLDAVTEELKTLLSRDVDEFELRYARLTPREREICDLIKEGRSSKEISDQLHVSLPTVHKHRERIRRKLKIMNKDVNLNTYLHFR